MTTQNQTNEKQDFERKLKDKPAQIKLEVNGQDLWFYSTGEVIEMPEEDIAVIWMAYYEYSKAVVWAVVDICTKTYGFHNYEITHNGLTLQNA